MDDLSGLSWSPNSNESPKKPPPMSSGAPFANARIGGISGRTTPASVSSGPSFPPSKPATPAVDSFANLVSFNSSNNNKNLSLQEQQKKLQEERASKEAEKKNQFEAQYGAQNSAFWDTLEKGGNAHGGGGPFRNGDTTTGTTRTTTQSDDDDLLAAFNASAPVDASTHFPVPSSSPSPGLGRTSSNKASNGTSALPQKDGMALLDDDDDPFGLGQLKQTPQTSAPVTQSVANDDDDFLGLLGKPVSEIPRAEPQAKPEESSSDDERSPSPVRPVDAVDRSIAQLVDMGFPADKARQALLTTESGTDVQAAVGWLLAQAHTESRQKTRGRTTDSNDYRGRGERRVERNVRQDREVPPWMREQMQHTPRETGSRVPSADRDPAQIAAGFGNNILKTANSLWKTGSKKVNQVVNDLNEPYDPNQPRWMRDASVSRSQSRPRQYREREQAPSASRETQEGLTNEALLLEPQPPKPPRQPTQQLSGDKPSSSHSSLRSQTSPVTERRIPQFHPTLQSRPHPKYSKSRLTKTAVEEQSAHAYVSPARRRRPAPQPAAQPAAQLAAAEANHIDLLQSSAPSPSPKTKPPTVPVQRTRPSPPTNTIPARPKAPPRSVPQLSQADLSVTHQQREKGSDAYKRGDYAAAHEAFTAALTRLPDQHPISIIIHSNRAMTALRIGEPKTAVGDADSMLSVIGPSKGQAETIDLSNGEPAKPMKDFFGKALMRKAEALEQLERWADAAKLWQQAVEAGYGGGTSIQGRDRCEKAAGIGKPTPKAPAAVKRPAPTKVPTPSAANSAAVSRLREATRAADRVDEERFALTENVNARLAAWKSGKQDNLRALLASLDTVLWPEAGWKKVNMSELIMPNKVKIQYMRGIGKVHPDKVCSAVFNLIYLTPVVELVANDFTLDSYRRNHRTAHDCRCSVRCSERSLG